MNVPVSKFCSSAFKHLQNMIPVAPCPSCHHLLPGLLPGWPCWSACLHSGLPKPIPIYSWRDAVEIKVSSCPSFAQNPPLASNSPRVKVKVLTMAHRLLVSATLLPLSFSAPATPASSYSSNTPGMFPPLRPLHLLLSLTQMLLTQISPPAPFSPTFSLCSKNHHLMSAFSDHPI